MARFEIKMPKLGESITEGTILSWSVQVGDVVNEDDVLFEVNTAKVSAEIPSPVAGKVVEILFKEGDTVPVGTVVAIVDMDGEGSGEASETAGSVETASAPKAAEVSGTASVPSSGGSNRSQSGTLVFAGSTSIGTGGEDFSGRTGFDSRDRL